MACTSSEHSHPGLIDWRVRSDRGKVRDRSYQSQQRIWFLCKNLEVHRPLAAVRPSAVESWDKQQIGSFNSTAHKDLQEEWLCCVGMVDPRCSTWAPHHSGKTFRFRNSSFPTTFEHIKTSNCLGCTRDFVLCFCLLHYNLFFFNVSTLLSTALTNLRYCC